MSKPRSLLCLTLIMILITPCLPARALDAPTVSMDCANHGAPLAVGDTLAVTLTGENAVVYSLMVVYPDGEVAWHTGERALVPLTMPGMYALIGYAANSADARDAGFQRCMTDTVFVEAVQETTVLMAFDAAFQTPPIFLNNTLANISVDMADAAYDSDRCMQALDDLGFKEIKPYNYTVSGEHTVGLMLGYKMITDADGGQVPLFAIVIRGTKSTIEWLSNFNVGLANPPAVIQINIYTSIVEIELYDNVEPRTTHLGFDKAAENAWEYIRAYIRQRLPGQPADLRDADFKAWVTGHSRGAAVGNLLAGDTAYMAWLTQRDDLYAYLFATPRTNMNPDWNMAIKNFVVGGDLVPQVPLISWGYEVHGVTYTWNNPASINNRPLLNKSSITDWTSLVFTVYETPVEYMRSLYPDLEKSMSKNPQGELTLTDVLPAALSPLLKGAKNLALLNIRGYETDLFGEYNLSELMEALANAHKPGTYAAWIHSHYPVNSETHINTSR